MLKGNKNNNNNNKKENKIETDETLTKPKVAHHFIHLTTFVIKKKTRLPKTK